MGAIGDARWASGGKWCSRMYRGARREAHAREEERNELLLSVTAANLAANARDREAAEKVAAALASAHAEFVRSRCPGVTLVRQASTAMPRRSYVERYKARLRVDWQKWDRASMARASSASPSL